MLACKPLSRRAKSALLQSSSIKQYFATSTKLPMQKRQSSSSNTEPPHKRQSVLSAPPSEKEDSLSSKLEYANSSENVVLMVDSCNVGTEITYRKWFLCRPTGGVHSLFWKHLDRFDTSKHSHHKEKAACKHCFKIGRYQSGTIACKGDTTGGLKRHIEAHHLQEFEDLQTKTSSAVGPSSIMQHMTCTKRVQFCLLKMSSGCLK